MSIFEELVQIVASLPPSPRFLWHNTPGDDATGEFRQRLKRCWPLWPLGHQPRDLSGLRIVPGRPISEWPMAGGRSEAATWGTSAAYSVPIAAYHCLIATENSRRLKVLRERWPMERAELEPLHQVLGGTLAPLDAIDHIINHSEFKALALRPAHSIREEDRSYLTAIDPSAQHVAFRAFLERQFDTAHPVEVPNSLGVWEGFATAAAFGTGYTEWRSYRRPREPQLESLHLLGWRLLHFIPQFDLGLGPREIDHQLSIGGIATADALAAAMVAVSKAPKAQLVEWSETPLMRFVVAPAAEDPSAPWHLGYMEAAAAFDGLEQPETAWNMLCAGAFWVNRRGGPWRPFFDAARSLAHRREWTDCAAAMDNMAKRAELDGC